MTSGPSGVRHVGFTTAVIMVALAASWPCRLHGQTHEYPLNCAPPPSEDADVYSLRDGWRCEGRIDKVPHSGADLYHLAALTPVEKRGRGDLSPLRLAWPAVEGRGGSIHAFPLVDLAEPIWQMDGRIDIRSGSVAWSPHLPQWLNRKDLGLIARAYVRLGAADRYVYLPVTVSGETTRDRRSGLFLSLWPWVNLNHMWTTLDLLDSEGRAIRRIWDERPEGSPPFSALKEIVLHLDRMEKRGYYALRISTESQSLGSDEETYYFFYSGP